MKILIFIVKKLGIMKVFIFLVLKERKEALSERSLSGAGSRSFSIGGAKPGASLLFLTRIA